MSPVSHRVVVIGYGMVGSRFIDELEMTGAGADVTVLGDEPHAAYNRLLLSDVIAGRVDLARLTLSPPPEGTTVHRDTAAVAIDRSAGVVLDCHGREHPYDSLVIASGASARIPDIDGITRDGERARGVRPVRSIDDVRGIIATAREGRTAIVLGGGVLGVEVACGLRARGCAVTLVQAAPRVMAAQLDDEAASVLAQSLRGLGVAVKVATGVGSVETDRGHRVTGVRLDDGAVVPGDMLVITAGIQPNVQIADTAGIPTEIGILTDESCRSIADGRVFAIGDCAQPPEGHRGLVAPGWEQARRAARAITGRPTAAIQARRSAPVVRLKAVGVDAVSIGDIADLTGDRGARMVRLSDPAAGRSVAIAVRDDRIEAAVCVGAPEVAALLATTFERGLTVPDDPAYLLLNPLRTPAPSEPDSPTRIPDTATLCRCNGVTKRQVIEAFRGGARTLPEVSEATRAATGCGGCVATVGGVIDWLVDAEPLAPASAPESVPAATAGREKDVARR